MTSHWTDLLPGTPADRPFNIAFYGAELSDNKAVLGAACSVSNIGADLCALMFAMGMQESNLMSASYHDSTKDAATDGSRNYSMFNLNEAVLRYIGYLGTLDVLNDPSNLPLVLSLIQAGVDQLGIDRLLNYIRGGVTGFADGVSFGVVDFRSALATILSMFDQQPDLMVDGRRVDIELSHV